MDLRSEIKTHDEELWVLCLNKKTHKRLSPLQDTIDWFNNQLISKGLLSKKIELSFGSKTLLGTTGLLPASRILVYGLGDDDLTASVGRKMLQDLGETLQRLKSSSSWIILPPDAPKVFLDEIKKSRTSNEGLNQATISVG